MAKDTHAPHEPTLAGVLSSAQEFLKGLRLPQGPFEPNGQWAQTYQVWLIGKEECVGTIRVARLPQDGQAMALDVDWCVSQSAGTTQRVDAKITCRRDRLATPTAWTMHNRLLAADGTLIEHASSEQKATCRDGVVTIEGRKPRVGQRPMGPWTSSFCLFELVQRLGNRPIEPLPFTLMDFLTVRKEGHTLAFHDRQEIVLGARKATLAGYRHLGSGILPEVYWLDEQQRLRIVMAGARAYIAGDQEASS